MPSRRLNSFNRRLKLCFLRIVDKARLIPLAATADIYKIVILTTHSQNGAFQFNLDYLHFWSNIILHFTYGYKKDVGETSLLIPPYLAFALPIYQDKQLSQPTPKGII